MNKAPAWKREDLIRWRFDMGYTIAEVGDALRTNTRNVDNWVAGTTRIPGPVQVAAELLFEKRFGRPFYEVPRGTIYYTGKQEKV